jgi:hypothetical protein
MLWLARAQVSTNVAYLAQNRKRHYCRIALGMEFAPVRENVAFPKN